MAHFLLFVSCAKQAQKKTSAETADFGASTTGRNRTFLMKRGLLFFIKAIAISLFLSQTTTSDTGYQLIGNPIDEPIFLTICGIALLFLGLYRSKSNA
jgi:hypothetical protein